MFIGFLVGFACAWCVAEFGLAHMKRAWEEERRQRDRELWWESLVDRRAR